jgi:hypothetical protein
MIQHTGQRGRGEDEMKRRRKRMSKQSDPRADTVQRRDWQDDGNVQLFL